MPRTRRLAPSLAVGLALMALAVVPAFAQGEAPPSAGASVPSDPAFTALLTDGTTVTGQVRKLGEKDGVTLVSEQGEERLVPPEKLVKLTREGGSPPTGIQGGDVVLFPDGDRLARCKIGKTGEFNLGVRSFALEDVSIPLDGILGLIFDSRSESDADDALIPLVRAEPRDSELVWLKNGDKLPGLFAGLDDKKLSFQPATGKLELPRDGVVALGFAQAQVAYRRPEGPFFELTLVDGSRLGVTGVHLERGQVVATTRFKSDVRLPIGELALVHSINGAVAYLSDREPIGAVYEAYLGPTRTYRRNATVSSEVLRVGGRAFDRGLGTQSRTLLVYKLEPGSRRFQAQVALDDRAGPLGNVVFKVRVDNAMRYESTPMASGEPARNVDIDVDGAKLLILMTEFGERGDVQDHADWIEARIIR